MAGWILLSLAGLAHATGDASVPGQPTAKLPPSPAKADSSPLTAAAILGRYSAAVDRFSTNSFSATLESSTLAEGTVYNKYSWKPNYCSESEVRFDGQRVSLRSRSWGWISPEIRRTKNDPYYDSTLLDGRDRYAYSRANGNGTLMLRRQNDSAKPSQFFVMESGIGVLLCFPIDGLRVDAILREASTLRLRDKMEAAGWKPSPCYVIEAKTRRGRCTIWIDPAHGYLLAKAVMERGPGDAAGGYVLKSKEKRNPFREKVRFQQFDGLWVPVEMTGGALLVDPTGEWQKVSSHYKVTRFTLNLDHARLRSFVPDDIRNGARTFITEHEQGKGRVKGKGTWQDGQVVDKAGSVIFTSRK